MADPKIAIAKTLIHEGGYVDNPNDSGGATKYGVTQRDLPGTDIKNLTEEEATSYYLEHYWKPLYSEIESQDVADKIFDLGVLFGIGEAVKLLEQVLNLVIDGIFGPHDLIGVNEADPITFLQAYKTTFVSHAVGIVNAQPKDRVFLSGWIRRINS